MILSMIFAKKNTMNSGRGQFPGWLAGGSLVSRVMAMFLVVMAVTAFVIAVFVTGAIRDITLEERGARQAEDANALAQLLTADLANEVENFKVRAEIIDQLALTANYSVLQRSIDRVQQAIPEYSWIGFADSEGRIIAATGGSPLENGLTRDRGFN